MKRHWLLPAAVLVWTAAAPASGQDASVSASLIGDIVRFGGSETAGLPDFSPGGEALGFALRVGTRLGPAWGVEAELARPGEIESDGRPDVIPLRAGGFTWEDAAARIRTDGFTVPGIETLIFPPISYRVRTAYRDLTVSAGAWARQDLSARLALVYSGGVGFHRTERKLELSFDPIRVIPPMPGGTAIVPGAMVTKTTTYSARPFAGIEARVGMTERLELVTGLRVHGLDGGVLVRPSIGLGWTF